MGTSFPQLSKDALIAECKRLLLDVPASEVDRVLDGVNALIQTGHSFEVAEASFILEVEQRMGRFRPPIELESFRIVVEQRSNFQGQTVQITEAVAKGLYQGVHQMSVAEGTSIFDAIWMCVCKDVGPYTLALERTKLEGVAIHSFERNGGLVYRVLLTVGDADVNWTTVAVGSDIALAAFLAAFDAVKYRVWMLSGSSLALEAPSVDGLSAAGLGAGLDAPGSDVNVRAPRPAQVEVGEVQRWIGSYPPEWGRGRYAPKR